MSITVFTTGKGCHKCLVTMTHLKKRGVEFEEVRMDLHPEWIDRMKTHGFATAPVVLVDDEDVWDGYSGESIDQVARELAYVAA